MILFDFSQIIISSAMDYRRASKDIIDLSLLRHISLNNVITIKEKLAKYADEIVLCMDGRHYWRREVFPYYKQNRKKSRDNSDFDWNTFFEHFNPLKDEFRENLPYKVLEIEGAEADDIISTLCIEYAPYKQIVIVSSDKDFLQLQMNVSPKIQQYSPYHKKFLKADHNEYNLFEHIVKGDAGDGIGNIFSDDDVFVVDGKRNKPISAVNLAKWSMSGLSKPETFCKNADDLNRFKRNQTIIDLTKIPDHITDQIKTSYTETETHGENVFNYLIRNKLKRILERAAF